MPSKGNGVATGQRGRERGSPDFAHAGVPTTEQVAEEKVLGKPGKPLNQRNPFTIGLTGAVGVIVAYLLFRTLADIGSILELIGVSLFLAMGLNPAVVWLTNRGFARWAAVVVVLLVVVAFVGAVVAAAIGPVSREVHELQVNFPKWRRQVDDGQGWLGHLVKQFHLQSQLTSSKLSKTISPSTVAGGVVGAGKIVLSAVERGRGRLRADDLLPGRPAGGPRVLAAVDAGVPADAGGGDQ